MKKEIRVNLPRGTKEITKVTLGEKDDEGIATTAHLELEIIDQEALESGKFYYVTIKGEDGYSRKYVFIQKGRRQTNHYLAVCLGSGIVSKNAILTERIGPLGSLRPAYDKEIKTAKDSFREAGYEWDEAAKKVKTLLPWRANEGESYFSVIFKGGKSCVEEFIELRTETDEDRWKCGNYFKRKDIALTMTFEINNLMKSHTKEY